MMNTRFRWITLIGKSLALPITLTFVILLASVRPMVATAEKDAPRLNLPTAAPHTPGPIDPAEMEAFLDELLAQEMEEHPIAGAAISIVKDGKLFFTKGYGYADLEHNIPVDPEQTGFRIGSVTKLFTWTAVMQLVEQGKLDLDADINAYLDFQIPYTYPQPITLKHLLTHTAGFEDLYVDFVTLKREDTLPPGAFLASHIPARVRPPGECAAYSNYGAALAGYIVARASGQSYDQYIQEHIFDPLGMAHSAALATFHPNVSAHESVGYLYGEGSFQIFPKFYGPLDLAPMGFMSASATDMARFMIAHLQGGRYSDATIPEARILQESTVQQMHTTLYTPDPRLLGTAYGFFDFTDNGQRTIGHSGTAEPMSSLLLLLPDQKLGVFVAYNSMAGEELTIQHLAFQRAFFDHYYPAPPIDPIHPPEDFAERAGQFVGSYRMARSAYTTLEKFIGFLGITVIKISDPGDGTVMMASPWGEWRFVEVEPLYFRQVDAPFHIVFREDERGHITHLFTDYTPQFGFEKLEWYETPAFHRALLLGCVLLFLSMIFVVLIGVIRRRRRSGEVQPLLREARHVEWIILGICVLNVLFVAGALLWNNPRPSFGVPLNFQIVLGLGVLSAGLTAVAMVSTVMAWKESYWGVVARSYYTLVTVAAVAFVWFLNSWNLLGWRF
jgi:CubicO group peptidase (beta-lactamase class C family)